MSYSVCLMCRKMVSSYEKLCGRCVGFYGTENQDDDFWRGRNSLQHPDVVKERERLLDLLPTIHAEGDDPEMLKALYDMVESVKEHVRERDRLSKK